jgi:hypothetical protein
MKLGYRFCRNALIKVVLLGIVGAFFLWDYFRKGEAQDDPAVVYIYIGFIILVWIAFTTVLTIAMLRLRREERRECNPLSAENRDAGKGRRLGS